jgi:hypothetical protein
MTHRILKLFRWQLHLDEKYGPHSLVWRKDGYLGVTIHELWGSSLFGRETGARLVHLGGTLAEGRVHTGYNAPYHHAHMHTAQFNLESSAPIAFVSFSWWREGRA